MQNIFTSYYQSPVGPLRISGTADYISEVAFEGRAVLPEGRTDQLPPMILECTEQLIQYFNGHRKDFDLPINQAGTTFQQSVWNKLMAIPYGRTISYLELARRMGDLKATRAVASSNGRNNIAIIVPCHRVIGSNNDLVGYGGGLWRKKFLLHLEQGVKTLF